ncbi:hypothetical protein DL546_002249 [Coniochaeta pulveracea]|uniref:Uncharacterized protein n=1 Tax=Coniochaeta pulveracea TaxID=177199 RepID=A0A420YGB2_9PEZI|nr:hypothetical protein DL546_002249 [Coniochaeta pulveracea]
MWLARIPAVRAPLRVLSLVSTRPTTLAGDISVPTPRLGGGSSYSISTTTDSPAISKDDVNFLAQVLSSDRPRPSRDDALLNYSLGLVQAVTAEAIEMKAQRAAVLPAELQGFKPTAVLRFLETLVAVDVSDEGKDHVALVLRSMSSPTFSEMLRSVDPISVVGPVMDPFFGKFVAPGMARYTQFGNAIDIYGIRGVYMLLFQSVVAAVQARLQAGHGLLISDYKQLIRCAGATSDPMAAKTAYQLMDDHKIPGIRDGDLYTEFIKARFLTEPLYTQFDKMRRRVVPINLYKEKGHLHLGTRRVAKLRRLRRHIMANQLHRYGQNRQTEHAEHLTRVLRKTKPIGRLWRWRERRGYPITEDFLCSAMIAFARAGSVGRVRQMLFKYYWISVQDKTKKSGVVEIKGSTKHFKPGNPLKPTVRLLEAVVESFGCNGEVVTALQLLMHISAQYNLTIPDEVWFDLLYWTQIRLAKPTNTEWNVLRWPNKAVPKHALAHIWRIMTAEPYNVKPGFEQYDIMIKWMISQGANMFEQAMAMMQDVMPQYEAALKEVEEAAYELALSDRPGMDKTAALRRWNHALARKEYMWYTIVVWCWNIPKKFRPRGVFDKFAVRIIPRLIGQFRSFYPRNISYRIATGTVTIYNPDPLHRVVRDKYLLLQPALVTGDVARKGWDALKPLKHHDVPLAGFHRRKMMIKADKANPKHEMKVTNQLRDLLVNGELGVGHVQRHFT